MHTNWNATLGSLWRTYKVRGHRAGPFVKSGSLTVTDSGFELVTKYDPPGSGWIAFGISIVTGIVVFAIAQATGTCVGPGWLLWFLAIALLRRRTVTLNLRGSETAIIDPANRRLAFLTSFEGKQRWIAMDVPQDFEGAAQTVAAQFQGRVFQDTINRALTSGSIAMIVMACVFAGLMLVSVIAAFVFYSTSRPRRVAPGMISHLKSYGAMLPSAITSLTRSVRRSRCTGE